METASFDDERITKINGIDMESVSSGSTSHIRDGNKPLVKSEKGKPLKFTKQSWMRTFAQCDDDNWKLFLTKDQTYKDLNGNERDLAYKGNVIVMSTAVMYVMEELYGKPVVIPVKESECKLMEDQTYGIGEENAKSALTQALGVTTMKGDFAQLKHLFATLQVLNSIELRKSGHHYLPTTSLWSRWLEACMGEWLNSSSGKAVQQLMQANGLQHDLFHYVREADHISACLPGKLPDAFALNVDSQAMCRMDTLGPQIVRVQIGAVAAEQVEHLLASIKFKFHEVVVIYKTSVDEIKTNLTSQLRMSNPTGQLVAYDKHRHLEKVTTYLLGFLSAFKQYKESHLLNATCVDTLKKLYLNDWSDGARAGDQVKDKRDKEVQRTDGDLMEEILKLTAVAANEGL